ncbi:hypothetical protein RB195_007713 [Necator americanus]|uniref:Uncharacterized protein n=1 Tax=Necator americanus TaxID=51031 RepID=A0ABR1BYK0_NECAM
MNDTSHCVPQIRSGRGDIAKILEWGKKRSLRRLQAQHHQNKEKEETGDTGTETGSTSASTGTGKRKKKKKAKKVKRKRRKDRYESQNYLLRIEGTLCCASLIIGFVWLVSVFIALIAFLVWAEFDVTATTDSVK